MSSYQASRHLKPAGGFELFAWYFMRVSGVVLVLLALGHLLIMHVLHNVEDINYEFVSDRWSAPGYGWIWRIWDLLMINLAVMHGCNGLRQILDELVNRPLRRKVMHTLIWSLATVLIVAGTYAIIMFVPDNDYLARVSSMQQSFAAPPAAAGAAPVAAATVPASSAIPPKPAGPPSAGRRP